MRVVKAPSAKGEERAGCRDRGLSGCVLPGRFQLGVAAEAHHPKRRAKCALKRADGWTKFDVMVRREERDMQSVMAHLIGDRWRDETRSLEPSLSGRNERQPANGRALRSSEADGALAL